MTKASEITAAVLRPLLERGLAPKKIAHELGCTQRTIQRRLKVLGLKKAANNHPPIVIPVGGLMQRSHDPLAEMHLTVAQASAALSLRMAYSDTCGLQGQDLIRMMMSVGSGFSPFGGGMSDQERAANERVRVRRWLEECRRLDVDVRPAIYCAGYALSAKSVGKQLGLGQHRTSRLCKRGLDVFARLFNFAPSSERRARHAWASERSEAMAEYASCQ